MAYAEVTDVEARWRPLTESESIVATARLADVLRRIKSRITDLDDRAAADADFAADVVQVQVDAVLRLLKNPDGKRAESIDDYSWTRDRALSDGALRITEEEWALLGVATPRRKAYMIDTTPR